MGWKATLRAMEAAKRRQQRESQKRQRELEQCAKEQAKLSAIERAYLEVETFENRLDGLLSIHKEQSEVLDWEEFAASLPPPPPQKKSYYELNTKQCLMVLLPNQKANSETAIEHARLHDEQAFQEELQTYSEQKAKWEKLKDLSRRVLAGDHKAYVEALVEFNPFAEMSDLGSSINFIVHDAKLIECVLKINGKQAIPAEVKTLTASEKVSIKPMPKGRFHEIYQNYLSGCVLRVAREVFALLPVDTVLITASADSLDSRTGQTVEQPVLSAAMPRSMFSRFNFDQLDPSDAMENFQHRGDFKASRKTDSFNTIVPLTPADIAHSSIEEMSFCNLLAAIKKMREEVKSKIAELNQVDGDTIPQTNQSS
jgi:hypothetical protein